MFNDKYLAKQDCFHVESQHIFDLIMKFISQSLNNRYKRLSKTFKHLNQK
jgi:hypothetical protein